MATFRYIFNGSALYGFPICGRGLMLVKNSSSSNAIFCEMIGVIKLVATNQRQIKTRCFVIHICDDEDFSSILARPAKKMTFSMKQRICDYSSSAFISSLSDLVDLRQRSLQLSANRSYSPFRLEASSVSFLLPHQSFGIYVFSMFFQISATRENLRFYI